jgi:hypothetical protein
MHVPDAQQPPLHGCVAEQVVVHTWRAGSQAMSSGQSAADEQPQLAPNRQAWPLPLFVQSLQRPLEPHAEPLVPGWQLLAQQPTLHVCVAEQAVVHAWVTESHALLLGQSAAVLQPHAPPPLVATHAPPSGLPLHIAHAPPCAPHAPAMVPATHVVPLQQPPLHGWLALQVVTQLFAGEHELPIGQSLVTLQPHCCEPRHTWPALLALQSTHAPPAAPHAPVEVPAAHMPLEQQLPLHGCDAEQVVVHWRAVVSHAEPLAQSAFEPQPHMPPPVVARHTLPRLLPLHATHAPPLAPHALALVPATQLPPGEQQPPLHDCVAEQLDTHWCVVVSHAMSAAQSALELQPHAPLTHACPALLEVQSAQVEPHALGALVVQVPPTQQAALHGCVFEQLVVHECAPTLHDCAAGQSLDCWQPHAPPPVTG